MVTSILNFRKGKSSPKKYRTRIRADKRITRIKLVKNSVYTNQFMYGVEGTCREKMLVVESYEVRRMYIWNKRPVE
jgi:hypothetical protein